MLEPVERRGSWSLIFKSPFIFSFWNSKFLSFEDGAFISSTLI